MELVLISGNIIDVPADAIVLPANSNLEEGSGTSAAIFQAAGRKKLAAACKKLGHCGVGNAVPTLAYDLNAEFIIHAVVPKWIDGDHNEYDLLCSAYLSALNLADVMECESIVFPLLASGNNGFDLDLAFQIARESIESFDGINLKKAMLVLFGGHVLSLAKNSGLNIVAIPADLKERHKLEYKQKIANMVKEGLGVVENILDAQLQKGLDYIKDEDNWQEIIKAAFDIVKQVFGHEKKQE